MKKKKSVLNTQAHMKGRRIKGKHTVVLGETRYLVPKRTLVAIESLLREHSVEPDEYISADEFFESMNLKGPEWAIALRGLRYREDLTQVEFAKAVGISQSNLSAMENGRRPIGKVLAKRIGKKFGLDYRLLL